MISEALIKSFDKVYGFQDLEERRVKSDMMNSVTFSILKNKLLGEGIVTMNDCIDSSAGNIKKHFYAGDYIFLLCKDGCTQNDTKITRAIEMQSCDKIIIQIQYTIDNSWNNLMSASFIYAEAGSTIFSYDIPLSYALNQDNSSINIVAAREVEMPKVTLKKTGRESVNRCTI